MISFILAISIGALYYYRRQKRLDKKFAEAESLNNTFNADKAFKPSLQPDNPLGFGYKNLWFAVKGADKNDIAEMLDFKILGPSNWKDGLEHAYEDKIFITPAVEGWTLVTGYGLLPLVKTVGTDSEICDRLSMKYEEAQFFCTHRVTEYHVWCRSVEGKTQRYYSYIGEQGENLRIEGEPSLFEKNYNLVNTFSHESLEESYFEDENLIYPNEQFVMEIAGNWSVNPTEIGKYPNWENDFGIVCELNLEH